MQDRICKTQTTAYKTKIVFNCPETGLVIRPKSQDHVTYLLLTCLVAPFCRNVAHFSCSGVGYRLHWQKITISLSWFLSASVQELRTKLRDGVSEFLNGTATA